MDQESPSPAPSLLKPLSPGTKVGAYTILERIAEGSTTRVYAAEDPAERAVALKILLRPLRNRGAAWNRFVEETRDAARVEHPHLVALVGLGDHGDHPWLAQEHVDGTSVDRKMLRNGRFDPVDAADLAAKCCRGLQTLFEKGRVHGALEPRHILLDDRGSVKLGESVRFSKMLREHDGTEVGFKARPNLYASPEEVNGPAPTDIRSDIHALGGVLFTLLTGQRPFGDAADKTWLHRVTKAGRASVREFVPEVPDELAGITLRAMALHPRERHQTPQELADALDSFTKRRTATDAPPPGSRLDVEVTYQQVAQALVGTIDGHRFRIGILPVVGHVSFPTEETWNRSAPDWAKNCWYAARQACRATHASMSCDATGWVAFDE